MQGISSDNHQTHLIEMAPLMASSQSHDIIRALPIWSGDVDIAPLTGGLSNEGYIATHDGVRHVVRLGDDIPVHHVSRENEVMASRAAHAAGFAPQLIHHQPGLLVFQFIDGKTFGEADVNANTPRIVDMMKEFHQRMPHHVGGPGRLFWVFHIIRDYARTLEVAGSRFTGDLSRFLAWCDAYEAAQPPLPIVYGHSDLLPANFIDDGEKLWLIDYEYAAYSTPLFDLANLASNAQFTTEQDDALLERYFDAKPTEDMQHALSAMKCASLLREAMWSMVSEHHLNAPGVDYAAYSDENMERFHAEHAAYEARYGRVMT